MGLQMQTELASRSVEATSLLVVSSPALVERSCPEERMLMLAQPSLCHRPMVDPIHQSVGRPDPSAWTLAGQLG